MNYSSDKARIDPDTQRHAADDLGIFVLEQVTSVAQPHRRRSGPTFRAGLEDLGVLPRSRRAVGEGNRAVLVADDVDLGRGVKHNETGSYGNREEKAKPWEYLK